jgi:hypothetical protein
MPEWALGWAQIICVVLGKEYSLVAGLFSHLKFSSNFNFSLAHQKLTNFLDVAFQFFSLFSTLFIGKCQN